MSPSSLHRRTTLSLALILALPAAGCAVTGPPGTPSGEPRPGTSTSTSTPSTTTTGSGTAPAATGPLTTEESAWLDTLEQLQHQMADIAENKSDELTPATVATTAKELRGCSVELARAGSPGARLQAAYALAKAGCEAFERSAVCLVTAASVGVPLPGTPNFRKLTESVACANSSLKKGKANLGNARMEGEVSRLEAG